jgi:hypothetical protein
MADSTSEAPKAAPPARRQESSPATTDSGGSGGGEGLKGAVEAGYKARVSVPGHDNVDARLDNRAGAARPPVEDWPAKPQQIDGPDLMHQTEHTAATLREREEVGNVKGMFSPGPHGLSGEDEREGVAHTQ